MSDNHKWNSGQIVQFLNYLQEYPLLFDKKHLAYNNRDRKEKAFTKQLESLEKDGITVTLPILKSKLKSIRQTFSSKLEKVRKSEDTGSSSNAVYVPKLIWFQSAMFLAEHINTRKPHENLAIEVEIVGVTPASGSSDLNTSLAESVGLGNEITMSDEEDDPPPVNIASKHRLSSGNNVAGSFSKKQKISNIGITEGMINKLDSIQENLKRDSIDAFGEMLKADMRDLTSRNQLIVREKVSALINELKLAQMESSM